EETRPELQTDCEDEQDQPEFPDEFERVMIHRVAEVPDENSREQHARRAQPDAANFEAPKRHAEHANQRERAARVRHRLRLVKLLEPVHPGSCYGLALKTAIVTRLVVPALPAVLEFNHK